MYGEPLDDLGVFYLLHIRALERLVLAQKLSDLCDP